MIQAISPDVANYTFHRSILLRTPSIKDLDAPFIVAPNSINNCICHRSARQQYLIIFIEIYAIKAADTLEFPHAQPQPFST